MILATVYHPELPVDYAQLTKELKACRGSDHSVLVLSRRDDEDGAIDLTTKLSIIFGRHFVGRLLNNGQSMIGTSNEFLVTALRFLKAYKPEGIEPKDTPMLYFDPTWRPKKRHWLDKLQAEYFLRGAPTVMADRTSEGFRGPVIFSREYLEKSALVNFLSPTQHWRKFLASELAGHCVHSTGLAELCEPRPDGL